MARYSSTDIERALETAAEKLGYSSLRPHQKRAVTKFVQGHDVFISLPTGSGKSLCFCILPGVFDELREVADHSSMSSIVVVVSPLISLMKDQVRAMTERGMTAVFVGDCNEDLVAGVCQGRYQLVYMSPEALLTVGKRSVHRKQLTVVLHHAMSGSHSAWPRERPSLPSA